VNTAEALYYGVESALGAKWRGFSLRTNLTWMRGDFRDGDGEEYPARRVPPVFGSFAARYEGKTKTWRVGAVVRWAGSQDRLHPSDKKDLLIRYDLLHRCIESLQTKTHYPRYEILIIDNQSEDEKTISYMQKLQQEYSHISVLPYDKPFNYSAINNFAATRASGEVLVLLNNDVEIISEYWLTELVQHALRPEIGAVGAMLYYDNLTIQHAGVILGLGEVAGHGHKYFPRESTGHFGRLKTIQNYSAVTGACLAIRKELFFEVGGLDEEHLTVAFNDVDLCLKLRKRGYRNLWTPYAELYHHE